MKRLVTRTERALHLPVPSLAVVSAFARCLPVILASLLLATVARAAVVYVGGPGEPATIPAGFEEARGGDITIVRGGTPIQPASVGVGREVCGELLFTADRAGYAAAFSWSWDGVQPSYYGALAECYSGSWNVCAAVFDPVAHVAPGLGYSTGWQNLNVVYGPNSLSLGIGAEVLQPDPTPLLSKSWGAVKALYSEWRDR